MLALGAHLGNGLAHLTSGHGWTWPATAQLFTSLHTILNTSSDAVEVFVPGSSLSNCRSSPASRGLPFGNGNGGDPPASRASPPGTRPSRSSGSPASTRSPPSCDPTSTPPAAPEESTDETLRPHPDRLEDRPLLGTPRRRTVVPWDRTAGVIGPQGSGKTLDLLTPALLNAPGAALVTLTARRPAPDHRDWSRDDSPCVVLDQVDSPGLTAGVGSGGWLRRPSGRRTASEGVHRWHAIKGSIHAGNGDSAARFYAADRQGPAGVLPRSHYRAPSTTILKVGRPTSGNHRTVGDPARASRRPFWHGLLHGALHGDERTSSNTVTTVQQALALFFQATCAAASLGVRPATDIADLIRRREPSTCSAAKTRTSASP